MTKIVMKFPPHTEKILSKIIKIDKPHEKGLIIILFKLLTDIFTHNSMHLNIWQHKFEENHKFVEVYYFVEVKS